MPKVVPGAGLQAMVGMASTASGAVGNVHVTTGVELDVAVTWRSGSDCSAGAVVSTTWTWNVVGVAALPAASVAVQVTVVLPSGNCAPEAAAQVAVPSP